MNRIGFISNRAPEFMDRVHKVIEENSWVKQVVSADLESHNDSLKMAVDHADMVFAWVKENVEGKFVRITHSRAYGFELETDIVLFHLTWGKG